MLKAGAVIVIVMALAAIIGPSVTPFDPAQQELPLRLAGPTWRHPFGLDELGRDILARVLAARARGVSRTRAVLKHAFRNSLIAIVTVLGLQFGAVLTGAVITETIFAWPGVGRLLIQSIGFRDYPLVQGCILLIAVTYVSMNLLTDLLYGVLDPRIRYE